VTVHWGLVIFSDESKFKLQIGNSVYGAEQTNLYIDFTDLLVKFSISQMILSCTANNEGEKTEVCKF
jgi:hypothetical protein